MIPLDEYIEKHHLELSKDIKCHLSAYAHADPLTAEGLHRLFFTSLRQYDKDNLYEDLLKEALDLLFFNGVYNASALNRLEVLQDNPEIIKLMEIKRIN